MVRPGKPHQHWRRHQRSFVNQHFRHLQDLIANIFFALSVTAGEATTMEQRTAQTAALDAAASAVAGDDLKKRIQRDRMV